MLSFEILPLKYSYSKNRIIVAVSSDKDLESYPELKIILRVTFLSDVYLEANVNEMGLAIFDISDLLDDMVTFSLFGGMFIAEDVSDLTGVITPQTLYPFTLYAFELYGNPPVLDTDSIISPDDNSFYVIKGGVNFQSETDSNIFEWFEIVKENKMWLTWYPLVKKISLAQQEFVSFFTNGNYIEFALLEYKIYEKDTGALLDTVLFFNPHELEENAIYHYSLFNGNYLQDTHFGDGTKVGSMTVRLVEPVSGDALSELRFYIFDHTSTIDERFIVFRNSLGGMETMALRGKVIEGSQIERTTASNYRHFLFPLSQLGTYRIINQREITTRKANTGFITDTDADYVREMLLSLERYEIIDNRLVPIEITSNKLEKDPNSETFSHSIEYRFAFSNQVYTPKRLDTI